MLACHAGRLVLLMDRLLPISSSGVTPAIRSGAPHTLIDVGAAGLTPRPSPRPERLFRRDFPGAPRLPSFERAPPQFDVLEDKERRPPPQALCTSMSCRDAPETVPMASSM